MCMLVLPSKNGLLMEIFAVNKTNYFVHSFAHAV